MNWLERARREISENDVRPAAVAAERNLSAATAAPEKDPGTSNGSIGSTASVHFQKITPTQLDDFEERAAIMEYDGGLSRSTAEKAAWALVLNGNRVH